MFSGWPPRSAGAEQVIGRQDGVPRFDDEQTKNEQSSFDLSRTNTLTDTKGYAQVSLKTSELCEHPSRGAQAQSLKSKRRIAALSTLAILWPILALFLYAFIALDYLRRDQKNGILVGGHTIDAKVVFYAWLMFSIFFLEWLKTSLAWFEAAVILNNPSWAPSTERQFVQHLDRGWASIGSWWRVARLSYRHLVKREPWQGPAALWWYLAGTYLLFSITAPLAGLSMDQRKGLELSDRPVVILGVNETTFDVRTNDAVSGLVSNNWRSGRITTPNSPAIFYAPEGTKNVSSSFFEDFAQNMYQTDLAGNKSSPANRTVKFFTGPPVAERVNGRAWGFLSTVSCSALNLQNGMKLINATGPNNWTATGPWGVSSEGFSVNSAGLAPVFAITDSSFGIDATYVIASDRDITAVGNGDYVELSTSNTTKQAIKGALEIAVWQSVPVGFTPDDGFKNMTLNPLVTSLKNSSVLGYGVRCMVESDVGYANLDAVTRTYSDFVHRAAGFGTQDLTTIGSNIPSFQFPGIFAMQSIAFQALSTTFLGFLAPPTCGQFSDTTCKAFYGANLATGGVPRISEVGDSQFAKALQIPSMTPERMTLAMYKLFGETASAMMDIGPGNWTRSDLRGLDPVNDLVPGSISWQLVLVLLSLWTVLSTLPHMLTFSQPRWSQTLEAYAIMRFGADWRDTL
ncbi:hypothetical protein F4777DRAFT_110789 [Nemania sp. FL0916]|nr:hypothetical protein F4777DRAFT_110789 [Nemania sp. FL0916]